MTRASWLLISSLAFVACAEPDAAEPDATADPGGKADGAAAATTSHVGDAVIAALDATAPGERGRTWSVSGTNRLASGWLVQSPMDAGIQVSLSAGVNETLPSPGNVCVAPSRRTLANGRR